MRPWRKIRTCLFARRADAFLPARACSGRAAVVFLGCSCFVGRVKSIAVSLPLALVASLFALSASAQPAAPQAAPSAEPPTSKANVPSAPAVAPPPAAAQADTPTHNEATALPASDPAAPAVVPNAAPQPTKDPNGVPDEPLAVGARRGLFLGGSLGFGLGYGSGYPNDAKYIDNEDYRGATGLMPGYGWNVMVLGAISPLLNVGFWGGTSAFESSAWRSRASGGGFRAEVFPFGAYVPELKNLALYGQVGLGSTKSKFLKEGNYAPLEGTQSFVALGVFHEFRFAKVLTLAPDARYEAVVTRAGAHAALILGIRIGGYTAE
jgi:hypothetical protein